MINLIDILPMKTYQTRELASQAVMDTFPNDTFNFAIFMNEEDHTFFPVAFGKDAVQAMVYQHINVVS